MTLFILHLLINQIQYSYIFVVSLSQQEHCLQVFDLWILVVWVIDIEPHIRHPQRRQQQNQQYNNSNNDSDAKILPLELEGRRRTSLASAKILFFGTLAHVASFHPRACLSGQGDLFAGIIMYTAGSGEWHCKRKYIQCYSTAQPLETG